MISQQDFNGETPSHWAALNGHANCVELLADKGANLNKQADNGGNLLKKSKF